MKSTSAVVGLGCLPTVTASSASTDTSARESVENFKITGTKKAKVEYKPEAVTVEMTYKSKDLRTRFDMRPPKFTVERTFDRDAIRLEDAPTRGSETLKSDWETYLASAEEWEAALYGRRDNGADDGISTQAHSGGGNHLCGRAEWTFKKAHRYNPLKSVEYVRKAPINVVTKGLDITDIEDTFESNGWNDLEEVWGIGGNTLQESQRYVYDKDREIWSGPDNEPHGEYCGYTNVIDGYGPLGRMHVRCWELEDGVVSIQAHEDGAWDPTKMAHDVISYENGKDAMRELFTSEYPMYVADRVDSGRANYGNDGSDDNHNGKAIVLDFYSSDDRLNDPDVGC
ncbi:hypothetical protein [Natrinema sp. H-ect4]|uniref:hypothetical protein n=1 Tax=Natrinema sp. H-ect4 TaxID=3242699 RepID=UPI0035A824F4